MTAIVKSLRTFHRDRRWFLKAAGGSGILAYWLAQAIGRAEIPSGPKRLLVVSRPNGTIDENWLVGETRGSILEPFAPVWDHAVALRNVDIEATVQTDGDPHGLGSITLMTGAPRGGQMLPNNDSYWNTQESLDQRLAREAPALSGRPIGSLQLGGWNSGPSGDEPSRALSFLGPASPLYPETNPLAAFDHLFADLDPDKNGEPSARVQSRRSVLDFVRSDLARVRAQVPVERRADLDAHEDAIRQLEMQLDGVLPSCEPPTIADEFGDAAGSADALAAIGAAMFSIIVAAFKCDITRTITFMWAGNAADNHLSPVNGSNHHDLSHQNDRPGLTTIDRWYSEQTANLIAALAAEDDPIVSGKLIDNTVVWYVSEIAQGWDHRHTNMPLVLFGGDGVGLANRGTVFDGGGSNTNDVWRSIATVMGTTLDDLVEPSTGPIPGLFG
jgi:hypothetical protein